MRRLVGLAVLAMSLLIASPVSADMPKSGLHLEHGAQNQNGCYDLEVWNGDTLVKTFSSVDACIVNDWSAVLPSGHLVFDVDSQGGCFEGTSCADAWSSDGTVKGTYVLPLPTGDYRCQASVRSKVVDLTIYLRVLCGRGSQQFVNGMAASRGTRGSTFTLPNSSGYASYFFKTGKRIVYASSDGLYASDGTRRGSHRIAKLPNITELRSNGRLATFKVYGVPWVSDGTEKGTHKVH